MPTKPDISIQIVTQAIAGQLKRLFPSIKVYNSPNQQNTEIPCFFINFIPLSGMLPEVGSRSCRTMGIDLVYLEDYNKTDLYDRYLEVAEILDINMDLIDFPYAVIDQETQEIYNRTTYMHTYNREWTADLAALHYKFNIKFLASLPPDENQKMIVIEQLTEVVND